MITDSRLLLRPRWGAVGAVVVLAAVLVATAAVGQTLRASGQAALAHIAVLSQQIGPRPAGTPADARTADYIGGELGRLGYTVERQTFPFRSFEETRPPQITVLSPAGLSLRPATLLYSASTPRDGVEADVVAAGLGRPDDFRDKPVTGRIALVERGEISFRDKVANAAAAGAVAVIVSNNQPGPAQAATLQEPSAIPAVMISQDEGRRLMQWLATGPVRVRMTVSTVIGERTSQNVIGVKRGTRLPTEIVVVGGHADSVSESPGANDNASGIAAMLEAARVLAAQPTARTIHFVAFGAEELGLIGSRHYVQLLRAGGAAQGRVVAMVNMDMVGHGPGLLVAGSGGNPSVLDLAERAASRAGIRVERFGLGRGSSSDHASFQQAGIPVLFIHTGDDEVIHTPGDAIDRINAALLEQAASLAAAVALDAATPIRTSSLNGVVRTAKLVIRFTQSTQSPDQHASGRKIGKIGKIR